MLDQLLGGLGTSSKAARAMLTLLEVQIDEKVNEAYKAIDNIIADDAFRDDEKKVFTRLKGSMGTVVVDIKDTMNLLVDKLEEVSDEK